MHRLSKCDVHKKLNERNEQNEHNDTIMKAEYVNPEKKTQVHTRTIMNTMNIMNIMNIMTQHSKQI